MAVSVDWVTKSIFVPQSDLTNISPGLYELDTNWFRLQLKDLEDSEAGQIWPDTHRHNTTVALGGIEYARIIEIINGYTVEFEDGQYAVNLVGSNNNIADVAIINQVSIRPNNSAGLVQTREIQYSSFQNGVTIDVVNGTAGVVYPSGTPRQPVNNVMDAIFIAELYGFSTLYIVGDIVFDIGDNITDYLVVGQNALRTDITINDGAVTDRAEFREASIDGTLDNGSIIRNCYITNLNYVNGFIYESSISGVISLGGTFPANIMNCFSDANGCTIDLGGAGQELVVAGFNGEMTLANKTGTDLVAVHANSASIILDASVTNGTGIHLDGVGDLINNSLITPDEANMVSLESIADSVWTDPAALTSGDVWSDPAAITPGDVWGDPSAVTEAGISQAVWDIIVANTGQTNDDIAVAVWEYLSDNATPGTMGEKMKQTLSVAKFLGLK